MKRLEFTFFPTKAIDSNVTYSKNITITAERTNAAVCSPECAEDYHSKGAHFVLPGVAATDTASTGKTVEKLEASNYSVPTVGKMYNRINTLKNSMVIFRQTL